MIEKTAQFIRSDADIVTARSAARALATGAGFSPAAVTAITTAVSELARNILQNAGGGLIHLELIAGNPGVQGLAIEAVDEGPGIADIAQAMTVGFSTSGGLGAGLPGVRTLMDSFEIESEAGKGTRIRVTKSLKGNTWKT